MNIHTVARTYHPFRPNLVGSIEECNALGRLLRMADEAKNAAPNKASEYCAKQASGEEAVGKKIFNGDTQQVTCEPPVNKKVKPVPSKIIPPYGKWSEKAIDYTI